MLGIPGFKYQEEYLLGYAAFKDHLSIFPTSEPIEMMKEKLKRYKTTKGTIKFTLKNKLDKKLLKEIITF